MTYFVPQKREDEQKAYVASCIAAGEMVPLQCDNMQFLDDEERDQFDRLCPHGYPYTKMVSTKMMLHGGGVGSLHPQVHVRLMLYAHKAVRVQGQVVGYGGGALRMRRVDTCACTFCDEVRRGVRIINNATGVPRSAGWSVFGDT